MYGIRFVYDISAFLALGTTHGLRASVDMLFIGDWQRADVRRRPASLLGLTTDFIVTKISSTSNFGFYFLHDNLESASRGL